MKELLTSWDIGDVLSTEPIESYWGGVIAVTVTSGVRYALKRRNVSVRKDHEFDLLTWLQKFDLPVAIPIRTRSGAPCLVADDGRVYGLYPWLRGSVAEDHYSQGAAERARGFGRTVAKLHIALREFPAVRGVSELDLVAHVREWVLPVIDSNSDHVDCKRLLSLADAYFVELQPLAADLNVQLIHRDIHPANMLFDDSELTGILDFEMVRRGPRIFDLCYCATSVLIGGWANPDNREAWPRILKALISGYEETILLPQPERMAIFTVLCAIEFIFMAFSLEQQQYGPAQCNQEVLFWLFDKRSTIGV